MPWWACYVRLRVYGPEPRLAASRGRGVYGVAGAHSYAADRDGADELIALVALNMGYRSSSPTPGLPEDCDETGLRAVHHVTGRCSPSPSASPRLHTQPSRRLSAGPELRVRCVTTSASPRSGSAAAALPQRLEQRDPARARLHHRPPGRRTLTSPNSEGLAPRLSPQVAPVPAAGAISKPCPRAGRVAARPAHRALGRLLSPPPRPCQRPSPRSRTRSCPRSAHRVGARGRSAEDAFTVPPHTGRPGSLLAIELSPGGPASVRRLTTSRIGRLPHGPATGAQPPRRTARGRSAVAGTRHRPAVACACSRRTIPRLARLGPMRVAVRRPRSRRIRCRLRRWPTWSTWAAPFRGAASLVDDEPGVRSIERLLARTRPDGVVVGTPPSSHAELWIAALEGGAHVICEKPFVSTVDEADRVLATAAAADCESPSNHQYRDEADLPRRQGADRRHRRGPARLLPGLAAHGPAAVGRDDAVARRHAEPDAVRGRLPSRRPAARPLRELPEAVYARRSSGLDQTREADAVHLVMLEFSGGRLAQITIDRLCRAGTRYIELRAGLRGGVTAGIARRPRAAADGYEARRAAGDPPPLRAGGRRLGGARACTEEARPQPAQPRRGGDGHPLPRDRGRSPGRSRAVRRAAARHGTACA